MTTAALPPPSSPGGMLIYFAVLFAICAVLASPIIFPLTVAGMYRIRKKRPNRLSVAIFIIVQIILTLLTVSLLSFLRWASQQ